MRKSLPILIGIVVVVTSQWLFFGRIGLWGATPDVVLLYVMLTAVRHGQIEGALTGFVSGFALDAIYGLWGINMFIKTLIGFLIGFLSAINSQVFERSVNRVVELTLLVSLTHNGLLVLFALLQEATDTGYLLLSVCLGGTLYTAFIAFLAVIFWRR